MEKTHLEWPARTRAPHAVPKERLQPFLQFNHLMRLMKRETGKAIQFEIVADSNSKVYVAGTFNNWDPTTHPLQHHPEEGVFKATLLLPEGTHEYKFVINGVWHLDAKCPHRVPNAHGDHNSVIKI